MDIPRYLTKKKQLIVFDGKTLTNNSQIPNHGNKLSLTKDETLYLYVKNIEDKENIEIDIKENSNSELFLIVESSKTTNLDMIFRLEKNSTLKVMSNFFAKRDTLLNVNRLFQVSQNAKLDLMNALLFKGKFEMSDNIELNGEEAEVSLDQLNIGSNEDNAKVYQDVKHNAKKTKSNIFNSLISNNQSKLSYSVSGRIYKGNEFSSCSQLNRGVILQEKGYILAEPKLFIDEYNVEANHGAAIGQIDDDQLFYLLSRGLTESEARSLIISGYTNPFIQKVEDEDIQKKLVRTINRKIKEANI